MSLNSTEQQPCSEIMFMRHSTACIAATARVACATRKRNLTCNLRRHHRGACNFYVRGGQTKTAEQLERATRKDSHSEFRFYHCVHGPEDDSAAAAAAAAEEASGDGPRRKNKRARGEGARVGCQVRRCDKVPISCLSSWRTPRAESRTDELTNHRQAVLPIC